MSVALGLRARSRKLCKTSQSGDHLVIFIPAGAMCLFTLQLHIRCHILLDKEPSALTIELKTREPKSRWNLQEG